MDLPGPGVAEGEAVPARAIAAKCRPCLAAHADENTQESRISWIDCPKRDDTIQVTCCRILANKSGAVFSWTSRKYLPLGPCSTQGNECGNQSPLIAGDPARKNKYISANVPSLVVS